MQPPPLPPPPDIPRLHSQIKELVAKNTCGVILLPMKATPDAVCAATSLYLALTQLGKTVTLASSDTFQGEIIALDKLQNSLSVGGNSLVISIPYTEGSVDNVDYSLAETDRLQVIFTPREGHQKLEPKDVRYTYTGGKIDFVFVIEAANVQAIGEIYQKNSVVLSGKNIVNIDRHLVNSNFGTINFVHRASPSTSEIIYGVIKALGVPIDRDIATNLFNGIQSATQNLTAGTVNAETFENVAALVRAGAVRKMVPMYVPPPRPQVQQQQMPAQMQQQVMPAQMAANPYAQQMAYNQYIMQQRANGQYPQQMVPQTAPYPMPQQMMPQQMQQPMPMPVQMPMQQPQQMMPQQMQQTQIPQQTQVQQPETNTTSNQKNQPIPKRNEKQQPSVAQVEKKTGKSGEAQDDTTPENWLKPKFPSSSSLI